MLDHIEHIEDAHIIVVHYAAPFEPDQDITAAQAQIAGILETTSQPHWRVDVLSEAQMDWSSFVLGIDTATRDVPGSMVDPRIQGILVGDYEMVKLASESMKQEQYGATNTPMFTSLDDALAYIREQG